MPTLLHIVAYGAVVVVFIFVTLSLASGLLWLAEIIEEHSRTAKIVGRRTVFAVIAFNILLYFVDSNLPLNHTLFSIACHMVYLLNFRNFPIISLTSWSFVASCLLVVADHFLWFFHFHQIIEIAKKNERRWRHPMEPVPHVPTFLDIATFFGICIWLVPLFLFLSLTANENALPTTQVSSAPMARRVEGSQLSPDKAQRPSLFVSLSTKALLLLPTRRVSRRRSRRYSDGIIAPHPNSRPSSPLHPGPSPLQFSTPLGPSSNPLIPPVSPLHSPIGSPTSMNFGTGSWVPVDSEQRPSSRPSTPGASNNSGDENHSTRRRLNLLAPPSKRMSGYTA